MLKPNLKVQPQGTHLDTIPDPWEIPSVTDSLSTSTKVAETSVKIEKHPLIKAASNPDALRITSPKYNPEQALLGDWLKLKAQGTQELTIQLIEALGLLYLLESPA
ncbi:hypothetical protein PCC8801_1924 [Rippkaea orientalis PCC 8801]|uniref:Uncharacterized protein n=1 Tax=Rippkaea orientalis (strain PCC 8801 / RF-1) TaxID=41431 RepID=B7JXZ8_RIPO1|nr:hypothetical protein [Rippkaea orientalis]ACK65962.1 hypothetical protein PCC8801_1924 [Rippkaea orientalis PCC 8801]